MKIMWDKVIIIAIEAAKAIRDYLKQKS